MPLPTISTPPQKNEDWRDWWFIHFQDHLEIQQAVLSQKSDNLEVYVIIPWSESDIDGILERHQNYHDDMNDALGLQGQDLSSFDPRDAASVRNWVELNYQEHQAARSALKI